MSASTVDNAVVVTITSATTAHTSDGIEFSAIDGSELQEQILDYAHHLAANDDQPVLLELRNPATGRKDVVEMAPDGRWKPTRSGAPVPDSQPADGLPPDVGTPGVEANPHSVANDESIDRSDELAEGSSQREELQSDHQVPASGSRRDDTELPDFSPVPDALSDDVVEAEESPWRGTSPGESRGPVRAQSRGDAARTTRGPYVPAPPAGGRLRTVWQRHRMPVMVIGLIALVAIVGLGVIAGRLFGASTVNSAPTDPAAAMAPAATADPTSDEVECPSRTTGALTTGRDPGNQTSGPNAIKAFNYGYYKWRSGNAARAVVSSNAKVGTAITLQRYIDVLDPNMRYCLAITEKHTGPRNTTVYEVTHTIIPAAGGERQTFRQDVTTTVIGGKHWVSEIDDK